MIDKDLKDFFQKNRNHWEKYKETVSKISRSRPDDPETALVKSEFPEMYCFDDIVKRLFGGKNQCASADALYIGNDILNADEMKRNSPCVYLIEFKPFSPDDEEQQESVNDSLYLKAVESYVVLSRAFFPHCKNLRDVRLIFWIVTNQRDTATDSGLNLRRKRKSASRGNAGKNAQSSRRKRLKELRDNLNNEVNRLKKNITVNGAEKPYIYDDVQVIEVDKFKEFLNAFTSPATET